MGLFSPSSPFDSDVEKATNENNTEEDWGLIMEICDKVGNNTTNAKDCLRSIVKRLNNADPHIALQAITLLDACVNNCGRTFQLEIASREFETELKKLLAKSQPKVSEKLRQLIKKWAEGDFKSREELCLIPAFYAKLKMDGFDFSSPSDPSQKAPRSTDPDSVSSQEEVDAIAKAIELSLKESSSSKTPAASTSLYPSVSGMASSSGSGPSFASEPRKVRALYDFEAAEDNELTFFAGEIIFIIDDSDQNWWKGSNQRGEGLFPANFVTSDLNLEPEKPKTEKKGVQFNESVEVKTIRAPPQQVEIDENKIDRLLHLLHEADPNDGQRDSMEMITLEEEVNAMGPLIDSELERVDRKHAQLTQLSSGLVEALNLYHTLMREPPPIKPTPSQIYSHPPMYNGPAPPLPGMYGMPDPFMGRLSTGASPGSYPGPPHLPRPEDMPSNPGMPFNGMYLPSVPPGPPPPQSMQPSQGVPQDHMPPHFQSPYIPPQPYPSQPPHNQQL